MEQELRARRANADVAADQLEGGVCFGTRLCQCPYKGFQTLPQLKSRDLRNSDTTIISPASTIYSCSIVS